MNLAECREVHVNMPIWRYMDFASFYFLLYSRTLFFRRIDKYSDEYEGALPDELKTYLLHYFSSGPFKDTEATEKFIARLKEFNTGTLSNSWMLGSKESYAMWKIYLRGSQEGIAIKTTTNKLKSALAHNKVDFTFAKVTYGVLPWRDTDYKSLAACKTEPYAYENELRVLVYDQFTSETKSIDIFPKAPLYDIGCAYSVDLENLIDTIHISPFAGSWFNEIVTSSLQHFLPSFDMSNVLKSGIKDR